MKKSEEYVVGLMSGTSLDGLDICLAHFCEEGGKFRYSLEEAMTIPYSPDRIEKLQLAEKCVGAELHDLHQEFGTFLGKEVLKFLSGIDAKKQPTIVSSHGHTIYHRPIAGYTFQLGSGISLAKTCGITTVCDFRTGDVALGGQGAPLVPIGDQLLFHEYQRCLNLGGFSNISFEENGKRIAFDICAVNYVLNKLALREGKSYDDAGAISSTGKIISPLLKVLNDLDYYKHSPPKSLGREWVEVNIIPLMNTGHTTADLLATFTEHIAIQIGQFVPAGNTALLTGGGAHNQFLVSRLKHHSSGEIFLPEKKIIDFKEALVFAFLGWLRYHNRINTLSSVTGASLDSSSGAIFLP